MPDSITTKTLNRETQGTRSSYCVPLSLFLLFINKFFWALYSKSAAQSLTKLILFYFISISLKVIHSVCRQQLEATSSEALHLRG